MRDIDHKTRTYPLTAIEVQLGEYGEVSAPNYEESRRGAAFDAVHGLPELARVRRVLSVHELRTLIDAVADALLAPNAQVHRKNCRSEAKANFSGATPC